MSTWTLDPAHVQVGFAVRHLMVATVKGRFSEVEATIEVDEAHPERSSVTARIPVASLDTGNADRDAHLRSADFLDAGRFPDMTFRSTAVRRDGDRVKIDGDLQVRDVSRPVTLHGEILGPVIDPWGNRRAGFELAGEVDREALGLTWNVALESGGVLVGRTVRLALEGEIVAAVPVPAGS